MGVWTIFIVVVLLLILIILIGVSYYAYSRVYIVRHKKDYFDEKYLAKRYIDGNLEKMRAYNENNHYIEVRVNSIDGLKLYGRLLLKDKKKFVILIHGYHSISNRLLEICKFYDDQGFSVLLMDLRAHGRSEGKHIGMGYKDASDAMAFINYLKDNYGEDIQIVVHGFSMGACTTMNLIKDNEPCIKFAVEDCGFYDPRREMKYKVRHDYHFPATPIYEFSYLFYILNTHDHYHKAKPVKSVEKTNIPLLIIHGEKDDFVPVKHAYKINEHTNSYHEMLIVPNAGHTMSYKTDKEAYENAVCKFIAKFIK